MVKSHVRLYELPRQQERGGEEDDFGLTLRGDCPVYVRSVDFDSPAHELGLRSGDLLLEVNGMHVPHTSVDRYHLLTTRLHLDIHVLLTMILSNAKKISIFCASSVINVQHRIISY